MDEREQFADLCEELEGKLADFNIYRYSIRRVNLNDVFIRICSSVASEGHGMDLYVRRNTAGDVKSILFSDVPRLHEEDVEETDLDPEIGSEMTNREYCIALLKKRLTIIKSGGYSIAFHFVIPLIFIWIVVFQAKLFVASKSKNPARDLTFDALKNERDLQLFYRMGTDDEAVHYGGHMSRVLGPYGKELDKTDRIVGKMFEVLRSDPRNTGYVKDSHMVAFEFRKLGAKEEANYDFVGYFASGSLHSAPAAVSLMTNVYLSAISAAEWPENKNGEGRSYRTTAINDPMPPVNDAEFEKGCGATCILLGVLMSFSVAFISHFCIILPMMERVTGMKHLQLMCGVPSSVYWFADFVVDCVIMFAVSILIILIFLADLSQTFSSVPIIFSLWLICILYLLWSSLMYTYFMSTILPKSMNSYNVMAVLHLCIGVIPMLWMTFDKPDGDSGIFWRNFLELLIPPYTITAVFYNFFEVASQRNLCRGINPYLQEICDVRFNPHSHTVNTGHYLSERHLYIEINKNDRKLAQCCDRVCLANDTCFKPPDVFNATRESWASPGILWDTFALLLQGFIFWGLLILSDTKIIQRLIQRVILRYLEAREHFDNSNPEPGVPKRFKSLRQESITVRTYVDEESFPDDVALVCLDLTKSSTSKMIIKDFCLEVKKGQCIAILGRGNSGKSCIASMIAGRTIPTKGNCYIRGSNLIHDRKHYLSSIGYSPQMNCLYPELTGAQMLELMGRLRGIPPSLLNTHVVKWLNVLGLSDVADEKCREYADGMSQRLRAAMAFIGEPEIILLDEPTTSVDPNSRQKLWAIIDHLNQQGHTIIFTTYSTDEAFSVSEKVVVIGDGSVQTIGEPDQLQRLYGKGHTILFKLRHDILSTVEIISVTEGRLARFKQNVQKTFRFIDLLDEQDELLMYFLRDAKLTWAEVHRRADFLAIVHPDIVDYYEVTEGEVDDIFVLLTNKYHELGTPRKSDVPQYDERTRRDSEMHDLRKAEKRLRRSTF